MSHPADTTPGDRPAAPRVGFYAGSFDPPTRGHCDLIARAAAICDALVVGVGCNPAKQPLLDPQRRVELLTRCCENQPTVRVIAYTGSTVAAAHAHGATLLVRGLRHGRDADHEYPTAECNRRAGLESIALFARPEHAFISASLVRELLAAGHDLEPYLPPAVAAALTTPDARA